MSWPWIRIVLETEAFPPARKTILLLLAYKSQDDGSVSLSLGWLARKARITPRAARYHIRWLTRLGCLRIGEIGTGRCWTKYYLNAKALGGQTFNPLLQPRGGQKNVGRGGQTFTNSTRVKNREHVPPSAAAAPRSLYVEQLQCIRPKNANA